ncbi:MbnP family protein [Flammeovirgaceae bacterium SG7u.111]|nr:MbnP family protein [Flammeovirgaceae bacterium SG7u.132]WPO34055.1 MbnP family protein [Flammeovirgaceae bacterium SG7u.111]
MKPFIKNTNTRHAVLRHGISFLLILGALLSISSCSNNDEVPGEGMLTLEIANLFDGDPLELDSKTYQNELGQEFSIQEFKFYLSNVKLRNSATGAVYTEPESYHLVSRKDATHLFEIEIEEVTAGQYDQLEFSIGVDPTRNLSLDNIGDLDPSNNMAWDWNTGYKFLLLEGKYSPKDGSDDKGLIFHVGSDANYRTVTLPISSGSDAKFELKGGQSNAIKLDIEVSEIFKNPTSVDFDTDNVVMFEGISGKVADNYSKMVSVGE